MSDLIDDHATELLFRSNIADAPFRSDNNLAPLELVLKNFPSFVINSRSASHCRYPSAFLKLRLALYTISVFLAPFLQMLSMAPMISNLSRFKEVPPLMMR